MAELQSRLSEIHSGGRRGEAPKTFSPAAVLPPMKSSNTGIRNIAHVDPGKTTLIDAMLS
jgi:hypothetical protein